MSACPKIHRIATSRGARKETKKKAVRLVSRTAFLSYGSPAFDRRFQGLCAGGPISRPRPTQGPLHIGTVAIWSPIRRGG